MRSMPSAGATEACASCPTCLSHRGTNPSLPRCLKDAASGATFDYQLLNMTPAPVKHEPWHIKREIQLSHLGASLCMAASCIWYAGKLEQRIALIEQSVVMQGKRDDQQDANSTVAIAQLHQQLDRIDAKLDRLIELRVGKP